MGLNAPYLPHPPQLGRGIQGAAVWGGKDGGRAAVKGPDSPHGYTRLGQSPEWRGGQALRPPPDISGPGDPHKTLWVFSEGRNNISSVKADHLCLRT